MKLLARLRFWIIRLWHYLGRLFTKGPLGPTTPPRMPALLEELDRAVAEYLDARARRDAAHVRFTTARDRLASIRQIAADILSFDQWWSWTFNNPSVLYAGLSLGEAIRHVLRHRAMVSAIECADSGDEFSPAMTKDEILEALESGGFEFGATPRREIHAALIQLDGITRPEDSGLYEVADAADIRAVAGDVRNPSL